MATMKIMKGNALLKLDSQKDTTESGIILLDQSQKPATTARVIETGKDVDTVEPGERVVVKPYAGREIEIEDAQYIVVDARYIIAKLED